MSHFKNFFYRTALPLATLVTLPYLSLASDEAADLKPHIEGSKRVIQEFAGRFKGELQKAMKEGGPNQAIEACHRLAPHIAQEFSKKEGWEVGRTSLKTRNSNNAPDDWETKVLKTFEDRKSKGEEVENLVHYEVVSTADKKQFRFMKAIPTAEICLKCHGENLDPKVAQKLADLYPEDVARGYKLGDIRGAFTISQPMD